MSFKTCLFNPCQTVKTIGESLPESPENLRSEVTAGTLLADPRSSGLLKFRVSPLKVRDFSKKTLEL